MTDTNPQRPENAPWPARHPRFVFFLPFLVYTLLVIPAVWMRRDQINPDGICYIRLSTYLLRHDWSHAISGYWSPLLPWCMAPLIATGIDSLYAAHIMLAVIGAAYLLAASLWIRQFESLRPATRFWMMIIVSLVTVRLVVKIISPDLLMAAILLLYLAQMHRRDLLRRTRVPFIAGLLGGLAYLAKAYAFPFFLVHFPLTLLLRGWTLRHDPDLNHRVRAGRLCSATAAGILGLLLVASPWIALLSHSYGRLTISTAGPFNHNEARSAPDELKYRYTFFVPPDPYLTESEMIDRRVHRFWSPFDSRERLLQQWKIFKENTPEILATLGSFDHIWLVPICLAVSTLMAVSLLLARRGCNSQIKSELPWLAMTLWVYCSGFTMVYFEPRLIAVVLRFPAMLLCVLLAVKITPPRAIPRRSAFQRLRRTFTAFVLVVFTISAVIELTGSYTSAKRDGASRAVADAMRSAGLHGPIASSSRGFGGYVAYFLDAKLITIPPNESASEYERNCREGKVSCIVILNERVKGRVVYPDPPPAPMTMVQGPTWTCRVKVDNAREQIVVYESNAE